MRRLLLLGILVAVAATVGVVSWVRRPATTPVSRGAALAAELGCFACHGPGGVGGVANPGSRDAEVPAWDGGVAMMYVENDDEIREWILYGGPQRIRDAHDEHERQARIWMPAYEGYIDSRELEDLVAFFKAAAPFERWPDDPRVRQGWGVASSLGCFGCHGPSGRVAMPNPRSFKGVIPAWDGDDFAELVRDEDELESWILDGRIERLVDDPIARRFLARQAVAMPAYRGFIEDDELDALIAYIRWLRPQGDL